MLIALLSVPLCLILSYIFVNFSVGHFAFPLKRKGVCRVPVLMPPSSQAGSSVVISGVLLHGVGRSTPPVPAGSSGLFPAAASEGLVSWQSFKLGYLIWF